MLRPLALLLTLTALGALAPPSRAQLEQGGRPATSFRVPRRSLETVDLPPVDVAALLAEDRVRGGKPPLRFGETIEVDLGMRDAGSWETLPGGERMWRLRVRSAGALSLSFLFSRFQLPPEGELYVYDDERRVVRGAYTYLNHKPNGRFAIQPTAGEALTLEYTEPAGTPYPGEIVIEAVVHDYLGVAESGACNVDVHCPPAFPFFDETRATVQITAGAVRCSGVLLDNTAHDGTQYLLTASHCGNLEDAVYRFLFQRPQCGAGVAPTGFTVQGALELVRIPPPRDFALVRILPMIPFEYLPYYAGWDRSGAAPPATFGIHHPSGDEKAICFDDDPPIGGPVNWRIARWEVGTTEGGSSGSGLFSNDGGIPQVVGSLNSGFATCNNPVDDFYTRMDVMWPELEPWLDPLGTGAMETDGIDPFCFLPLPPLDVTGVTPDPIPVLQPGTGHEVLVHGAGFTDQVTIEVDGAPVDPGSTSYVNIGTLALDFPLVDGIGTHVVTVSDGSTSRDLQVEVGTVSSPKFQIGTGDPGNQIQGTVRTILAGQPGELFLVTYSVSDVPSIHPLWMLDYGNQFTQLLCYGYFTIPAEGYLEIVEPLTGPFFTRIWASSTLLNMVFPAQTSNTQEVFLFF